MSAPEAPIQLGKSVGLVGVVTFGAGTAIGVSIFTILGPTAQVAGAGLLPAIGLAALPMLIFALAYAYLGSALPVSGASYEWPRRFIHPAVGFLIAWMRIVANVGAMAILSQVLVGYLGMVVPLPPLPAMAALITLVFALNYRGVALAAKAQTALMALLLVVLTLLVALGLPHVRVATMGAPLSVPLPQVLAAVPLMISLFLGIESAVEIGEEVRNPARTMPLGIALAIALTALGLVGPAGLAASKAPLLDAAHVVMGSPAATILIVGAATLSIVKSMNALALTFSRSLFAMGRSGALPTALGRVHPRFATPHVAVLLAWACAMAGMLLPQSLVFLLLAVNLPTMLKYAACSWSATVVARHHPEIHARAALGMAPATVTLIGLAGVVAALAIAAFGVEADPRPYLLVGGWLVLGLAWWFAFARKS